VKGHFWEGNTRGHAQTYPVPDILNLICRGSSDVALATSTVATCYLYLNCCVASRPVIG